MKIKVENLLQRYSCEERNRIITLFKRLIPHLMKDKFALTGSLALRYHLVTHNIPIAQKPFNDIDLVVEKLEQVFPSVTRDFLVNHYHTPKPDNDKFIIQLVDPVSRTRTDIFPFQKSSVSNVAFAYIDDIPVPVISTEDLFVQIISVARGVFNKKEVSPKHFQDINTLLKIVDFNKATKIWNELFEKKYMISLSDAIKDAQNALTTHGEFIKKVEYRADENFVCLKCDHVPNFSIANAKEVIKILGYI